jgi:hypothetical protein
MTTTTPPPDQTNDVTIAGPSPLGCDALRDDLLALLYDEGTPTEKARAKAHVTNCAACRDEFAAFADVRSQMSGWVVPADARGNLAHGRFGQARPARASSPMKPASFLGWSLAAAAGIALGVGLATTGRSLVDPRPESIATAAAPALGEGVVSLAQVRQLLDEQDRRHQAELAGVRERIETTLASLQSQPQAASSLAATPASFQRVLRESEDRHTRLVEARIAQLRRETELQRQYDLAQVAASLAFLDNRAGAEAARTSELMKNLVRVTTRPQDR